MKQIGYLLLLVAVNVLAAPRQTKIALTVKDVPDAEARRLLVHYCQTFVVVTDKKGSDYELFLLKNATDLPYSFIVVDPEAEDLVDSGHRSSLAGAVKDACSAMHIRFGEDSKGATE